MHSMTARKYRKYCVEGAAGVDAVSVASSSSPPPVVALAKKKRPIDQSKVEADAAKLKIRALMTNFPTDLKLRVLNEVIKEMQAEPAATGMATSQPSC